LQDSRRLVERHFPTRLAFSLPVNGDTHTVAQCADRALRPAILAACDLACPVQNRRYGAVRHQSRQFPNKNFDVFLHCPAVFARRVFLDFQIGMVAALPMQHHLNKTTLDPRDNLVQHGADDPLARYRGCGWMRPGYLHIGAKAHEMLAFLLVENWRAALIKFLEFVFEPAHVDELAVPPPFEFARDEAVIWIDGIILPACVRGFENARFNDNSTCRRFSAASNLRCSIACSAASTPSGFSKRTTSAPTAWSTRKLPKEMQRSPPWFRKLPLQ
jgi:hypothetical protein